jgi:hypothetical protein
VLKSNGTPVAAFALSPGWPSVPLGLFCPAPLTPFWPRWPVTVTVSANTYGAADASAIATATDTADFRMVCEMINRWINMSDTSWALL